MTEAKLKRLDRLALLVALAMTLGPLVPYGLAGLGG